MNAEVMRALEELRRQFPDAAVTATEDGMGGAYLIIEPVQIGPRFKPSSTWMGTHIPPQYPYADLYPVFMGPDVTRADGIAFVPPITPNANFQGRPALQISRKNNAMQQRPQTAVAKFLKVLDFLSKLP